MLPTRQRTLHSRLPALLCLSVFLAACFPAGSAQAASQDELNRIRERIETAQKRVAATRDELSQGQSRLRDAERQAARIAGELRNIRKRERELNTGLARLDSERQTLDRKADSQARALASDMRAAWRLGQVSPLRLWLNAEDPQRAARIARYYEYLQRDRAQRIAAFAETREQLAQARERIAGEQEKLATTRAELADRERQAREAREERRKVVAQLAGELKTQRGELERLRANEAALKRVLDTAREAFRDVPPDAVGAPFRQRRGKLRWPVTGRVAAGWGAPLAEGKLKSSGLTFSAAEGSDVRAVHNGRVVYADWLRGYGLLAILDHGDGFLTVYGYNQTLLRNVGDWVREGEAIATVGTSGGRSAPGLYFEVRVNGEPQDPARWLRR
ncbi:MAG: murein hydrolase activator EnvC family protein [Pseudomonadota bacterium]